MKKFIATTIIATALASPALADIPQSIEQGDGGALYERYCAKCHGKLEKTRIPDRRTGRIASAIKTMGIMADLKHLSTEKLEAISRVLATDKEPLPGR